MKTIVGSFDYLLYPAHRFNNKTHNMKTCTILTSVGRIPIKEKASGWSCIVWWCGPKRTPSQEDKTETETEKTVAPPLKGKSHMKRCDQLL